MTNQAERVSEVSSFQVETTSAVARVRASLSTMAKALGPNIQRPADLQRSLSVDGKLCWQVFNVIHEPDTMAAATHVPGAPSLSRLIRAAQAKGVGADITAAVQDAVAEFDRVIERHADDRTEFNLMASSIASPETAIAAEREWRKSAYRAERHIWGLSTDVVVGTAIARLNADRASTDECGLLLKRGLRRLRPDANLDVMAKSHYGAAGIHHDARGALDPAAAEIYNAPILPEFCTKPVPPFRTIVRPDGYNVVQVASEDIGRRTAVDLSLGSVSHNCPLARTMSGQPSYQFDLRILTPARSVVLFLLVHRPTFGIVRPEPRIFRLAGGDHSAAVALSQPQIPVRDAVYRLPPERASWQEHSVERHDDLIEMALGRLGWNPAEFDVFRLSMEFPVLHTVIRLEFPVAGTPSEEDASSASRKKSQLKKSS